MSGNLGYKDGSFGIFKSNFMDDSYSDHYPIYATITTQNNSKELPTLSINELKSSNQRAKISGVAIYKDKNGYILADESRRGIYIYEKNPSLGIGMRVDAVANKIEDYKGNMQISSISYVSLDSDFKGDESSYMMDINDIDMATSGDVIGDIVLDIKGGFANISNTKFKIYSPNRAIKDGKISIKKAIVWSYKGQKELIIE